MSAHNSTVSSLPKHTKADILRRDVFGRTALHIAVLSDNYTAFRDLLAHPDSHHALLLTDYENGWNVLHLIFYHKRLRCWTALRNHLNTAANATLLLTDLLKRKDRSRLPPLALLQNDSKELMWIPGYINERGDAHLVRRFAKVPRWIPHDWWSPQRGSLDVYMYGSNSNHHLGVGDARDRSIPSRVLLSDLRATIASPDIRDLLRRPRVSGVGLGKYHSVIVMCDGRLLTCGMGARGRLGHGNTSNLYQYQSMALFEEHGVALAAVTNSHTLALTIDNQIFAWGVNSLNQLGFTSDNSYSFKNSPSDIYENTPKAVSSGDLRRVSNRLRGVAASNIHSVAYASHLLFFWGLDIGQMGPMIHSTGSREEEYRLAGSSFKGHVVTNPREVAVRDEIKIIATCETCTCVITTANDIFIYYGGQRVKLPKIPARGFSEASFDCFKPSRLTRAPDIKKVVAFSHTNMHVLLTCGDILSFSISPGSDILKSSKNIKFNYIWKAYDSDMRAVDMDGASDGSLVLCTKNGYVFMKTDQSGVLQRRNSMSTSAAPIAGSKFRKVENINRVVRVSCDNSFASFAFEKDDVDSLPYKLQKNDFFKDMEYLSILSEADAFRKQDQLLDTDHESNCYITDYIFPSKNPDPVDEEDLLVSRVENLSIDDNMTKLEKFDDLLFKAHNEKFSFSANPETKMTDIYQALDESSGFTDLLKDEEALRSHLLREANDFHLKFYDGRIKFANDPSVVIGFHTKLLEHRSSFCLDLFHPKNEGEYFIHEKMEGHYKPVSKELVFKTDVDLRAVVVLLHFIYTNKVLSFWDDYPGGSKCPESIRRSKNDFRLLKDLFRMDSFYGKDSDFLKLMLRVIEDPNDGDVLIELNDGKESAQGSILVARSALFETILSSRWESLEEPSDETKVVSFENVNSLHFRIILKHMHGCNDLHVFDDLREMVEETLDSDDFVNFLLELIEMADEMLLLQLKHLCELAIQEFIDADNVLVLLAHSDYLGANHLLMLCCWYVYNNLEIILFDSNLQSLPDGLVAKSEKQMQFFQNCKRLDFVIGDHGEINKSMLQNIYPETMVGQFLTNPVEFNKMFMDGQTFEPLLDIKPESEENKRKLSSSRRMSRKSSMDAVAELRKLSLGARKASENAIEDFEVVGRRRKLKQRESVDRDDFAKATIQADVKDLTGTKDKTSLTDLQSESRASYLDASSSGGTPWGSRRSSASSQAAVSAPILGSTDGGRKGTKIKFAPSMKLSQKQRRKMNQTQVVEQPQEGSSVLLRNPWAVAGESNSGAQDKLSDLPVLGATKAPEPRSLAAVMLQESTRLEEQRYQESQRLTLQEIQQEQEFAKWWEEESKRVQLELGPPRAKPRKGRGRKKSSNGIQ